MSVKGHMQMTDMTVNQASEAEPTFNVIATVAGTEFDFGDSLDIPDAVMKHIITLGITALAKSANGAAKLIAGITKLEGDALEERKQKVAEAVGKTIEQVRSGIIPGRAKAASKVSGKVQTLAMRMSRDLVKDLIRSKGLRVGAWTAKQITEAATKNLAANPHILVLAQEAIDKRAAEESSNTLDIVSLLGDRANSEEVKAKPKSPPKRKASASAPISAKQAQMVAPRQRPTLSTH